MSEAPLDDLMGNPLSEPVVDVAEAEEENVEIQVVDDRPEGDQVSPRDPEKSGDFDPDAEIVETGSRAEKRIKQLRYEYHEQRRGKESAERMREEAVNYAQNVHQQNAQLKELLQRGEQVLLSEIKARTESDLGSARDQYRSAYEEGDADRVLKAQEALTRSQYDARQAEGYQPLAQEVAMYDQPFTPQQQQAAAQKQQPAPDPKLQEWVGRNSWFGRDSEMTSFAYGVHEKLVRQEGVDPRSEAYYQSIDQRMREVFPHKFGNDMGAEEPVSHSRNTTVVAAAKRSSGPCRQVKLTSTQVALAKRLGLSPEQYAKQLLKETK